MSQSISPPAAKARMMEMIGNIKAVMRDRLQTVDWMTEPTRPKALAKFDRFETMIGHPEKWRDYSKVDVKKEDYFGNVSRAAFAKARRNFDRVGQKVDRGEWYMTPPTVNAYFAPNNQIVFPAGILQPPFFDPRLDDAVNYGAIGGVIGHEITHGFDDQGRHYDADGNLKDWWTAEDAAKFRERTLRLVSQFNSYQALPGLAVNGQLALGENIADLGGVSIAFEALIRRRSVDCSESCLRSRRVLEKLGMVKEGTMRRSHFRYDGFHDMDMFSILRDEKRG